MKMVHVVPHVDQEASGPSYSVPRLCESLAMRGHHVELSCLAARGEFRGVVLDVHAQWPVLGRFAVSPSHAIALGRKASRVDIVHNHSLWSMVNVATGWVVPGRGAKLVVSPRGTLSTWALNLSKARKRAMWPLQRRLLARADLLHATSEQEYDEIRALGLSAPVAIVPNGVDLPRLAGRVALDDTRTLLFLSRIHPKKAIDRLLHAWAELQSLHPEWRLVIAGVGEPEHVQDVQAAVKSLGLRRVEFPGPLYGPEKSQAYLDADLFVLPTHSENFGMVVAEALAHACPVVVSRGAPWSSLKAEGCGWWVSNDTDTLTQALDSAMGLSDGQRQDMGRAGRHWMERDFSWASVAGRMNAAYDSLLHGGKAAEFIRTD